MQVERVGKRGQAGEDRGGKAAGFRDFESRSPRERFHGGTEGARGSVSGELDREHSRHTQSDGDYGERGTQRIAAEGAKNQPVKQFEKRHGGNARLYSHRLDSLSAASPARGHRA